MKIKEKEKLTVVQKESAETTKKQELGKFVLCMYVSGFSPKSTLAISNIKNICEEYLKGRYELEVIDIYQNTDALKRENIVTTPTLIKKQPLPIIRILGDLSDKKKVMMQLGLLKASGK